jgi:Icc-related predicted phosphoesterase
VKVSLLCLSDTHDRLPPVIDQPGVVAVLHAGDFCSGENQEAIRRAGSNAQDMREWVFGHRHRVRQWLDQCRVPIYAVRGNHDVADTWGFFAAANDVTGRVMELVPGLFIAGIGWIGERYYDLPLERDLDLVCQAIWRQAMRQVGHDDRLILLTHYPGRLPPAGQGPTPPPDAAFHCIAQLIETLHPEAVVQGHVHSLSGRSWWHPLASGKTLVVNPGSTGGLLTVNAATGQAEFSPLASS